LDGYTGQPVTHAALRLAPHVFLRPGELRAGRWEEIDFDAAVWRIPAERMKMKRGHQSQRGADDICNRIFPEVCL
jgi:integrase